VLGLTNLDKLRAATGIRISAQSLLRGELDQEFHRDFLKLVGEDPEPLMPEELAQVVRDVPRDTEVTDLLKALSGARPLPPR
jgi:hypothetical protein